MDNAEDAHASAKCIDIHGVRVHANLTKLGAKLCGFCLTLIFIFVSIPYRTIRSDFYDFDEDHYRAVGRRKHGIIKLGDPLRIRVKGTNLEQKLLDYELVEPEAEKAGPAPTEDEFIESLVDAPMPNRPRKGGPRKGAPRKGALKAERERMKKGR